MTVCVESQAGRRQQIDQLCGGGCGAFARAPLQVAPGQQEKGKHAHRVEIEFTLAGDGGPDAGDVRTADRQRHRHVHGQVAGAQIAQCSFEEVGAAVEDDRRGEQQGGPAKGDEEALRQVQVELGPGGHGGHHYLHPQQPGYAQLAQRTAVLAGQALGSLVGLVGVCCVADPSQLAEQLAERQLCVAPAYVQAMIGQVEAGLGHAVQVAQVAFDQPAAGGAADPFDHQRSACQIALVLYERLLDVLAVVQRHLFAQFLRESLRVDGGVAAVLVVALQPTLDDGFSDGLAAWAAQGPRLTQHAGLERTAGWHRQAAVVAGERLCHQRLKASVRGRGRFRWFFPRTGASPDHLRDRVAR